MNKKILLILCLTAMICVSGCSKEKEIEKQTTKSLIDNKKMTQEIKDAKIEDMKIQVMDKIVTLPINLDNFLKSTDYSFSSLYATKYDINSVLKPEDSVTIYLTSKNSDIILANVKNVDDYEKQITNCSIRSIDVCKTTDAELNKLLYNQIYFINGISYGDKYDKYKKLETEYDFNTKTVNDNTINYYIKDNYYLMIQYDKNNIINELKYGVK